MLYDTLVRDYHNWALPPIPDLTVEDLTTYHEAANAGPAPAPISIDPPAAEPVLLTDTPVAPPVVPPVMPPVVPSIP